MNKQRLSHEEVREAVTKFFEQYGFTVEPECPIQFGAGKGRMAGSADVVVRNAEGYWIIIVECKSERVEIGLDGEWQLKSYLSATDTRFGILAASRDPADWVYFENLRSNVFIIRERLYFNAHLNDDPRSDRPDRDAINQLRIEKEELEIDNEKLTSDNNQLKTDSKQLTSNNEQLETGNNQLKTDNEKLTSDNNQLKTDNEKLTSNNEQLETGNNQLKTDNEKLKRKLKNIAIGLIVPLLIAVGISVYFLFFQPPQNNTTYQVKRIIDGDTFEIQYKGKLTSVQLIGVNAPEPNTTNNRPPEPYSEEATKYLQEFLLDETVYFDYDQSRFDKHERILGYVYRSSDGVFVNLDMIREGYAKVDLRYPFKYEELFTDYESRAKTDRKGLWGGY